MPSHVPILEFFSIIACVVTVGWIFGGPGKSKFRRAVGIPLVLIVLLSWVLLYFGMYGGPFSATLMFVALVCSVICFVFPVLHKKIHNKRNVI